MKNYTSTVLIIDILKNKKLGKVKMFQQLHDENFFQKFQYKKNENNIKTLNFHE